MGLGPMFQQRSSFSVQVFLLQLLTLWAVFEFDVQTGDDDSALNLQVASPRRHRV
jgi:hypothetical protein